MGASKLFRQLALKPAVVLPREKRIAWNRWLRGRHEYRKLRAADCVIVSFPKSGRTWLRVMLTRFYQIKFNTQEMRLVGFNNLQRTNPEIPRFCFTHDNYIKDYTKNSSSKADFYDRKVIFLVRDPRDVAVSSYFQRRFRPNPAKNGLRDIEVSEDRPTIFEFVMFRIPRIIDYFNAWQREMPSLEDFLLVRYEDLRAEPEKNLKRILAFIGTPASDEEVQEAVSFASYESLKKLEQKGAFGRDDRRLTPGNPQNPNSYKVRRAKVGGYRDYFGESEISEIDAVVDEGLSPVFGYGKVA
jgi:hypothetical protein